LTIRFALSILKNPFVLSSLGGVVWKLLHLPLPGKGALGLALLAGGAGDGPQTADHAPVHGFALLSWNQHREPAGSRRSTPLFLFQH
jgi:hypothetical protein